MDNPTPYMREVVVTAMIRDGNIDPAIRAEVLRQHAAARKAEDEAGIARVLARQTVKVCCGEGEREIRRWDAEFSLAAYDGWYSGIEFCPWCGKKCEP